MITTVRLRVLLDFALHVPADQSLVELEAAVEKQPDDADLRYQLGCACVVQDQYEQALESFMTIMEHDRQYRDDAGRKALLAALNMLDDSDERLARWRRRMFNALH